MRRALAFLICAATLSLHAQHPGSIEIRRGGKVVASNADASRSDLRILFIGNSLTFWNEMPWMFEQVARSLGARPKTQFSGRSGLSLRAHWREGRAQKSIAEGKWDFVVIQPQSTEMMRDPEETMKYARMFDELVRESGAKTVIFLTWAPRGATFTQEALTDRYLSMARRLNARVAPIGVAWAELARSGIEMEEGGAHPTLAGSYLSTCVLYATLYGKSPAGAMHTFDVKFDIKERYRQPLETEKLAPHVAETIQRKAWEVVRRK
ncbi:MAG TPA: hypothetical protein VFM36_08455 [Thermoanaerobaculia bacterium]|nr:hypothetical protein [Thermoanaerobaculia bacterium]